MTSFQKPLAERIRPQNLSEYIGQNHLRPQIKAIIESNRPPSVLFFGPPGSGKSTLALLIARSLGEPFLRLSASEIRISNLRQQLNNIHLLILDEIHRLSKNQQDFFLPLLETGKLILLSTTTENPSFNVTNQLLSRLHVLRLNPINKDELAHIAIKGLNELDIELPQESVQLLINISHGDARTLLNLLEHVQDLPSQHRNPESLKSSLPEVLQRSDKEGDSHYELASALIKSIRGSDPDAVLYYLAAMIEGGEDPRFICRRLILSASEDIGLADPQALILAVSCAQSIEMIGMPEGFIPMAETATYLALAPKSNSTYAGYLAAQKEIRNNGVKPIPLHLRNPTSPLQKKWGYGDGYKYPHSYQNSWVDQVYLPQNLYNCSFYQPKNQGQEPQLNSWLRKNKQKSRKKDQSK